MRKIKEPFDVYVFGAVSGRPFFQLSEFYDFEERFEGGIRSEKVRDIVLRICGAGTLEENEVPRDLVLTHRLKAPLPDMFKARHGAFIISASMRAIIEELDLGLHQFFPVDIFYRNGDVVTDRLFYIMVVSTWKMSLIPSLSPVNTHGSSVFIDQMSDETIRKERGVFEPAALDGAHLWREKRISRRLFASRSLYDGLQEAGLKFFKPGALGIIRGEV